jgi:hypothetical protein
VIIEVWYFFAPPTVVRQAGTTLAAVSLMGCAQVAKGRPSEARAERMKMVAKAILESDRSWTPVFSPSIRLKSLDLGWSNLVSRLAPPEFSPGPPTSNACGMHRFQMKLFDEPDKPANEFAVLLDPQPAGDPVKPIRHSRSPAQCSQQAPITMHN